MNSKELQDVIDIAFSGGLKAGIKIGRQRVLDAVTDLHIHSEQGAIVYLSDLEELLEERDAQRVEADLP